jgi:hypothetical protein
MDWTEPDGTCDVDADADAVDDTWLRRKAGRGTVRVEEEGTGELIGEFLGGGRGGREERSDCL